jgi:hypothetical protein
MTEFLYEEGSFGVFVLVTLILGGSAGWRTGRAAARTWRPVWHVVFYCLLLGLAVRFIHYSLFDGTLLSVHYYAVDAVICVLFGVAGFRKARVAQMVRQYGWIYEAGGPFRWRRKSP